MSLKDILELFGTEAARENFLKLCRNYYGERTRQEAAEQAKVAVTNSRRAELHNEIMVIVRKLYLHSNDTTPPTRKEVGNMIVEHFRKGL